MFGDVAASIEKIVSWLHFPKMEILDFVEIIIVALLIYYVVKWIKNTRAWVIVKGLVVLVFFWAVASFLQLDVILWIFKNTIGVGITALIILFQPELRRVLESLGGRKFMNLGLFSDSKEKINDFSENTVDELVEACFKMGAVKTGALIVIEQNIPLGEFESTGINVDGLVSAGLLINIFEHNTPLHDGAVIIRGNRITSATCYLPLSDMKTISKELGTRHRAGLGASEVTDAVVLIVSEETGKVSVARNGMLRRGINGEELRSVLMSLVPKAENESKSKKLNNKFNETKNKINKKNSKAKSKNAKQEVKP